MIPSLKLLQIGEERLESFGSKTFILLKPERRYPGEISISRRFLGILKVTLEQLHNASVQTSTILITCLTQTTPN